MRELLAAEAMAPAQGMLVESPFLALTAPPHWGPGTAHACEGRQRAAACRCTQHPLLRLHPLEAWP